MYAGGDTRGGIAGGDTRGGDTIGGGCRPPAGTIYASINV